MSALHFLRPYAFFLLIPFLLLLLLLKKGKREGGEWEKICDAALLPFLLKNRGSLSSFPLLCLAVTGMLGITALAGPSWKQESLPSFQGNQGLVIALDLSHSMLAEDLKPNRLQRALYKISDILQKRKEGQTALLVYTDHPYVVTPLTNDIKTIAAQLSVLEPSLMPSQGLRHDLAVVKGAELLKQGGVVEGGILLVTAEGGKQGSVSSPFPVSVLGVGTEEGAPIPKGDGGFVQDEKGALHISKLAKRELTTLAKGTGGQFAQSSADERDIQKLLSPLTHTFEEQSEATSVQRLDQGYWLVLLLLPLAFYLLRRSGFALALLFFCFVSPIEASLWKTADQHAAELFANGDYEGAKKRFRTRQWRGAACYKAGDFEGALQNFQGIDTPDGCYNLGNAYAKLGSFEEAIAAYTKTLEMEPEHEDAAYNKKLLEEMKKEDQQDQEQQQDEQQQDQQKDEQQQDQQKDEQQQDQQKDEQQQQQDQKEQQQEEEQTEEEEEQQEREQRLLERVPDDPGGLLRRKFLYQYKKQRGGT